MNGPRPWLARLGRAAEALAAAALALSCVIIFVAVVARYGFGQGFAWSEQGALVLMIWFIMLGSAAGVRNGLHIRLSAIVDRLPPRAGRLAALLACSAVAGFGLLMAAGGADLVVRTWTHAMPGLPIGRGAAYLPIPIAGLMIALFSLEQLWAAFSTKPDAAPWR